MTPPEPTQPVSTRVAVLLPFLVYADAIASPVPVGGGELDPRDALRWLAAGSGVLAVAMAVLTPIFGLRRASLSLSCMVVALAYVMTPSTEFVVRPLFMAGAIAALVVSQSSPRLAEIHASFVRMAYALTGVMIFTKTLVMVFSPPSPTVAALASQPLVEAPPSETYPDIWWIVLDGRAREDVITGKIGVPDNLSGWLREQGFFVAPQGHSNYTQTLLSVGSALNGAPIQSLIPDVDPKLVTRTPLHNVAVENRSLLTARAMGYTTRFVPTGYSGLDGMKADETLEPWNYTIEYDHSFISKSGVGWLWGLATGDRPGLALRGRRANLRAALDVLQHDGPQAGPTFTFVHMLAPHPPFVFDAQGNEVKAITERLADGDDWVDRTTDRDTHFREAYGEQSQWVDGQIRTAVTSILARSKRPPIILIHGDHGSGVGYHQNSLEETDLHERFSILLAVYLPGGDYTALPADLTPIALGSIAFSAAAGKPIVPQAAGSWYTSWVQPYTFAEVHDAW